MNEDYLEYATLANQYLTRKFFENLDKELESLDEVPIPEVFINALEEIK